MGYLSDHSRSVGAWIAEEEGALPASRITQDWCDAHGIEERATFIRWLIRIEVLATDEWHHTSKRFNRTPYYRPETIKEFLAETPADRLARYRRFFALPIKGDPDNRRPRDAHEWLRLCVAAAYEHPHPLWADEKEEGHR